MGKYFLVTFGCQMNKNDSERIVGLLDSLGMKQTNKPEDADLLIVNTCSVRQSAEDRVVGLVRNWQALRQKNPNLLIAITGCMPGRDKDGKLKNKIKGVDFFFPIADLNMLPVWLKTAQGALENYTDIELARSSKFQAFITIQTGCNNYCTYCVVPKARGPEKNRPLASILSEAKIAVDRKSVV
jgi:tRNA-2-methylthio-N6-dimethylallyladenosine synthase